MQVETLNFGQLNVRDEDIITFKQGLPGFEPLHRWMIVNPDPDLPFSYLQSLDQGEIALIMTDPFNFYPDYELKLTEDVQSELLIEQSSDVLVWSIVSIQDDILTASINLLAPVVINLVHKIGKQIILNDQRYRTKHSLFPEHNQKGEVK